MNPYLAIAGLVGGALLFARPSSAVARVYGDTDGSPPVPYPQVEPAASIDAERVALLQWRIRDAQSNLDALSGELSRTGLSAEQMEALGDEWAKEMQRLQDNQIELSSLTGAIQ